MILVDTSVWADHLRAGAPELAHALEAGLVYCHPFVIGELACGNLSNPREVLELRFPAGEAPPAEALAPHVERVEELPDRLLLYTADGERAQVAVASAGHRPLSALVRRSSLEDVFLRLTGRSLVE